MFDFILTRMRITPLCRYAALVLLLVAAIDTPPVVTQADEGVVGTQPESAMAERVDFTRDVRPILSNACFQCHGPDDNTREADLRFDTKAGAFANKGGTEIIVPHDPTASELIARVTSDDPEVQMPPPDADVKPLTAAQITTLRQWIDQGAGWEEHWAFVTPTRPQPPQAEPSDWPRNDIDRFVLSRMHDHGLQPSPEANRETLLRRVTFDLTGLPPTLEEIDAFLADASLDAYEHVVDRLLASPAYGEHMARYWLDIARYGDTHGLHLDNMRSLWPYRDWLIDAFNENKPFDRMTIEQLGGDLLPEATREQKVATGFNRCNVTTSEGGSIDDEYYVRYAVDRVETMSTVFMGLTTGCAVCHDHKFDPITQAEFYQLYAYFNSTTEKAMDGNALLPPPILELPTAEQQDQRVTLQKQLEDVQQQMQTKLKEADYIDPTPVFTLANSQRSEFVWIDDAYPDGAKSQVSGHPLEFVGGEGVPVFSGEKAMKRTSEGLSQHFFTEAVTPLLVGQAVRGKGDKLFAYVYLDPQSPPEEVMLQFNDGTWEHRATWGADKIDWGTKQTASRKHIGPLPEPGKWVRLEVSAAAVGLKPGAKINGWAFTQFGGTVYWDQAGIVSRVPQGNVRLASQRIWEQSVTLTPGALNKEKATLPEPVRAALAKKAGDRTDDDRETLRVHFLEYVFSQTKQVLAESRQQRVKIEAELKTLNDAIAKTMISEEMESPKPAYILERGEYDKPQAEVHRGVPAMLPAMDESMPNNRLGLARWLVDPAHPLTARVAVNRWWQRLFGTGLVKTSEDFGIQGEHPTHPQLLDWLAVKLVETGWNVKAMQKRLVMSATYRQRSDTTPAQLAADPYNRYLSHGPRFRMEAEMIRDQALAISGLLNEHLGGPSVKPYQPAGLWKAVGYTGSNTVEFKQDQGEDLYRRSMYTFWKRTSPPPTMATFDAPSRESCTVRRARTNTPLQALALLNNTQFIEAARHFAERVIDGGGTTTEERLVYAFRSATARAPSAEERTVLRRLLDEQLSLYIANPSAASELVDSATTQPEANHADRDKSGDAELAAWMIITNLLLNLDEVVVKG